MSDVVQIQAAINDRRQAEAIADALLAQRAVACVQILGPMTSRYWWNGEIATDEEWLVLGKTTVTKAPLAMEIVEGLHPYEVPEIVVSPLDGVASYLAWVEDAVGQPCRTER